jgi:hypothetical protein
VLGKNSRKRRRPSRAVYDMRKRPTGFEMEKFLHG